MHQYPTPSDLRYGDSANTTMLQGGTQWGPGRPDSSHSAVNYDAGDRQGAQHLRASQSLPSNYTPATTYTATSRDSYPVQAQSHCSPQYPYPSQPYPSAVNYILPPYDFAEYPVSRYFVLCVTRPSIHRAITRCMQATSTTVDSIPPMDQQQLITSILPLILSLSTPTRMTRQGTSPRTAPYAPHSRVNISTAWSPFLATRTMRIALRTMSTMPNPQSHQSSRLPALPSWAMLSWRPLRQSLSTSIMALLPFLALSCRPQPLLNVNHLRLSLD
jgi:hypothetical protein